MNIKTRTRKLVAALALAVPIGTAALALAPAANANENTPGSLTLSENTSNQPGNWNVDGNTFFAGRGDVQVWIMDLGAGTDWSVYDYKSGIGTSNSSQWCNPFKCWNIAGGSFSVAGDMSPGWPWSFGPAPLHPLECDHQYEAVAYDPADGYVYSNVFDAGACPVVN
jgi:hypothetical protein